MAINIVDYRFVQKLPENLSCSICLNVLQKPQMVNCCEKLFCKKCLIKWKEKNNSCPCCRSQDFTHHMEMHSTVRKVQSLQVYCPNSHHGCQTTPAIKDCELHLSQHNPDGCLYITLPCPNGCGKNIFRADLDQHCNTDCLNRTVTCPHCGDSGWYVEMIYTHPQKCLLQPLPCPRECGAKVARKDLAIHPSACPLEQVECPFKDVECTQILLRKDMDEHLSTATTAHLTLLVSSLTRLKSNHQSLKADCETLMEKNTVLEGKLEHTGLLLQDLHSNLAQPNKMSSTLKQINTVLLDTTEVAIGGSISLELSRTTQHGYHKIVVDKTKFQLEWDYNRQLQLELFLTEQEDALNLWSCDFVAEIEPHQETEDDEVISNTTNATTAGDDNIKYVLAVVCCGKPQSGSSEGSNNTRQLSGPAKTLPVTSDATLMLTLKPHDYILIDEDFALKRGSMSTNPSSLAHLITCTCLCHHRARSISRNRLKAPSKH